MARNLGTARVSVLSDGSKLGPDIRAQVKEAVKGVSGKIKLDLDTKTLDAQIAAEGAKIIAMQNAVSKARAADAKTAEREIASRASMYKGMFDQIAKSESMQAAQEAAMSKAQQATASSQQAALDRIAKARQADSVAAQKDIDSRKNMYSSMFDQIAKSEQAQAAREAAGAAAQQSSLDRISKARQQDILGQQKGIQDTQKMYSSLFDDLDARDKIKVGIDGAYTDEQFAVFRAKIDKLTQKTLIRLGLDDAVAEAEALTFREKLKATLSDIRVKVHVDNDSLKSAGGTILGFFGNNLTNKLEKSGEANGGKFGSGFISGLAKSALMQNPGITAAVIAGLAALPAAIGAVAVLGGIALGGGIMTAAILEIKKEMKAANTALKQAGTQLAKDVKAGASTSTIAGDKSAVADAQKQLDLLTKEAAAYQPITNGVTKLKQSFIDFSIVVSKPLIKPFAKALDDLSAQLNGPLAKAFTKLFTAVAPLVKPVEDALLEIVNGILPGLTDMLNKARAPLSAMFESFGKIVGLKVGQWFRDAIPFIKDSGTYLNELISILGSAGSFLIKFGGQTAIAFSDPALKGFGSTIRELGNDLLKVLVPAFQGWIEVMAPVIKDLAEILTPILNFLVANPALVKAIATIAALWFLYGKAILVAVVAAKILTTVMGALDIALDANIVGLIVLAIEALAVAVFLVIKNWKPISKFFVGIWHDIYNGFAGPLVAFFTVSVPHAFSVTINWVKKNWPVLVALLLAPMTLGMSLVLAVIIKYHAQIVKFITETWGHIENVITGILKPIASIIGSILKPIASVVDGVWNEILKITKNVWAQIYGAIRTYVLITLGIVGEAWRGIKNVTNEVWPWIYNTTKDIWGKIENAITGIVKPLVSFVSGRWDALKANTKAAWDWILNTSKDAWGHIENVVTGAAKPTASVTHDAWTNMERWTSDAWNYILHISQVVWGKVGPYVVAIVKAMVATVIQEWKDIKNWTLDTFNGIYNYIINPLNKAATWVGHVFVNSVVGAFKGLIDTVETIWNGLRAIVATPINFVINDVWNPFAKFVNGGLSVFGIKDKLPMGTPVHFATGGHVPGYAPGSDTVPAMLSPGEYVLNPTAAKAIGVRNLDAINSSVRPGGGQAMVKGAQQAFANGGDVVADATKWNGHRYVWGGGANPGTGWDCSSFVNWIVGHDFKLNLPGGSSWGATTNNGAQHGPVVSGYENWNYGHHVPWASAQKGDLALENGDGHIGFVVQDNTDHSSSTSLQGFAARSTATGTGFQQYSPADFHLVRFADDRGFADQVLTQAEELAMIEGGAQLKSAASAILNGVSALSNGALNHIPGGGVIPKLAKTVVSKIISAAQSKLQSNQNNYEFTDTSFGPDGTGTTGTSTENGTQLFNYLKDNLFGGNEIAAAGATASIWGESLFNPFASGTGGRGLIGWTPPSTLSNSDFQGGMATQLPDIIKFVNSSGDQNVVAEMMKATSVAQAADEWMRGVERAGVSDVHSQGIAIATQIMNTATAAHPLDVNAPNAPKAPTPPGAHHATGGHIPGYAPGSDTVPAMLSPGEYVLNPTAVKAVGLGNLNAINFGVKPGSPAKFATGGTVAQTTIINKEGQIAKEKNLILALQAIKKPTAANILSLKNDKITLSVYDQELASYLHTNSAAAEKTALAAQAAAAKKAAAEAAKKAAAIAAAKAAVTAADIQRLGTHFSHSALIARAASDQKKMTADYSKNHFTDYAKTAADYNMTEAALAKWPTQANAQHDAIVVNRDTAAGYAARFLAKGDLKDYAHWNQVVAKDNAAIAKIDAQISAPAQAAPPNTSNLNPIQKLAYVLGGKDNKLWTALAYQLRNKSLNPAPVGDLSHADMSALALNVTPSVLDVLYGGPGTNNSNYQALASALQNDLFNNSGIYNAGSGQALGILGKLTGQHGLYAGKKFAQGGFLPPGPGIGFPLNGGTPFSYNEGGRREKIVTEGQQNGMGSSKLEALMTENNRLVAENTQVVAKYGIETAKGLGGVGRSFR